LIGSRCIVQAAREKKLIAAGRRQNIGPARKGRKEREGKSKKERRKEEKLAKKFRGLRPSTPRVIKNAELPAVVRRQRKKENCFMNAPKQRKEGAGTIAR